MRTTPTCLGFCCNNTRRILMSTLSIYSSQSSASIQLLDACLAQKFLAALKSLIHVKSTTLSAYLDAISFVASVDPVSATTISKPYGFNFLRHSSMYFSSFFAMMHTLIGTFDMINSHSPFSIFYTIKLSIIYNIIA